MNIYKEKFFSVGRGRERDDPNMKAPADLQRGSGGEGRLPPILDKAGGPEQEVNSYHRNIL